MLRSCWSLSAKPFQKESASIVFNGGKIARYINSAECFRESAVATEVFGVGQVFKTSSKTSLRYLTESVPLRQCSNTIGLESHLRISEIETGRGVLQGQKSQRSVLMSTASSKTHLLVSSCRTQCQFY